MRENTPQSLWLRSPSEMRLPLRSAIFLIFGSKVTKNLPCAHQVSP